MIVEGFDNAWHVLRHWLSAGYECFVLEPAGRVPQPRPCRPADLAAQSRPGLDYFPIPTLLTPARGDNPDPERALSAAEIILAAAIAEGWEPVIAEG